jgi:hypothetical protein
MRNIEECQMEITTVARAHTQYSGLKTAIPATLARELNLQAGDKIAWEMDKQGEIKILVIRKHAEGKKK